MQAATWFFKVSTDTRRDVQIGQFHSMISRLAPERLSSEQPICILQLICVFRICGGMSGKLFEAGVISRDSKF